MGAALITLVFCVAFVGLGVTLLSRWIKAVDPAAQWGLGGLAGLGTYGTLQLFMGLVPGGLWSKGNFWFWLAAGLGGYLLGKRGKEIRVGKPQGIEWVFVAALAVAFLFAFVGALAPPDANEWDSLAYHLAVPKLWRSVGQIHYLPFTHHSNFPFAVDNLFIEGLRSGSHAGAKAYIVGLASFGTLAIFGLTRQLYGRRAAWWATLAFATVPVVLWLSGTAYIDVPNGLYAGLGIALVALYLRNPDDRRPLWLAAVMLGFAAGSKYTGLQTIFACGVVLLIGMAWRKRLGEGLKLGIPAALLALLIASPWYIKNAVWTGNPVYPFFYSRLGGKDWDERRAAIYTNEQQTFGVGRTEKGRDITQLGHAVLGLTYQPGRYINPMQTEGGGNPLGAVGVAVLGAMLAWAFSGRAKSFELACLAAVGLSLLTWFFLSQQSRYIVTLAVPLAIMLGGGVVGLRAGPLLAGITALQAAYSIFLVRTFLFEPQVQVVTGKIKTEDYLKARVPFYEAAMGINQIVPKTGKVALYDEVFGYYLNVPYFWANPGHSTVIPYDSMQTGEDFAREMAKLGFTHIYVNLAPSARPRELTQTWVQAMGLAGPPQPLPVEMQEGMMANWEQRYIPLIADAAAKGTLRPVQGFRSGVLLEVVSPSPGG